MATAPRSRPKLQRVFFPDVPLKKIVGDLAQQAKNTVETLFFRIVTSPVTAWYEAEDAKHVVVDSKFTLENSVRTLNKLISRDISKMGDLDFIKQSAGLPTPRVLLLESYSWAAVCLMAYVVAVDVGSGDFLQWMIGPIFHPLCSLFMAMMVPFYVHSRLRKAHWPEDEQRSAGFYGAVAFGLFASYALGQPIEFASFICLVPLWIAHVSGYLEFRSMNRLSFLVLSLGVPYLANVYRASVYFDRPTVYIMAWTAMFVVIAVDLQLKLGRLQRRWAGKELEHWDSTAVMMVAHFVISQLLTMMVEESANENPKGK